MSIDELQIFRPDGQRFLNYVEIARRAEEAEARANRLGAKLREMGIDPEQV